MIIVCICAAPFARAAPEPRLAIVGGAFAAAQWNTPGLLADAGVRAEIPLPWTDATSALLRTTRAGAGVGLRLSPSFLGLRAFVEAEPVALLVLRAGAEALGFFGTFSNFLDLPSDAADFSLEGRNARAADARRTLVYRAFLQASPRLRVGPFVAFSDISVDQFWTDAPSHFYEATSDVPLAREDLLVTALSAALWELGPVGVGLVHRTAWVPRSGYASHRVGPGALWRVAERWGPLAAPTLLAAVCLYLQDRYKAFTIYFAAALQFGLTLLDAP